MAAPDTRFCFCCAAPVPAAPALIENRPGLTHLAYRIGTFATFREAMLTAIAREPALVGLTTRESDDYAITLLELFAAVGDVLTFYSERIANEHYLRTAAERDSVLRLVRLIGYRLRPGQAATTVLAFALDDGATTRIRKGLKVMSVPGQDERPQTFETLEAIVADARLNALPVFAPPLPFNAFQQGTVAAPLVSRPAVLSVADRVVMFTQTLLEEKTVEGLDRRPDGERLRFAPGVLAAGLWPGITRAAKLTRRLRFFGHNAPATFQQYDTNPTIPPQNRWTTQTINAAFGATTDSYPLDARYEDLKPGAQLVVDAGPGAAPRFRTATVTDVAEGPETLGQLSDTVTHVRVRQTIEGRPAAVVRPGGGRHVFARGGAASVLSLEPPYATQWDARTGVIVSEDPSAVAVDATRVDLFVRDAAARLRYASWNSGAWTSWVDLGGILTSRPVTVAVAGPQTLVFVRGLDLALWVTRLTAAALIPWTSLGGILTSEPEAVSWGGTRVDVFVRGLDRALWRRSWDGTTWSPWESLDGTLSTPPSAAAPAIGRLDVVALDPDGALIHRRWTGTAWSDWTNLGGRVRGRPAIVATGSDRVDVFARGEDDQLWTIARTGTTWSGWIPLGGSLSWSPAVVGGADVHVNARGADGSLVTRSLTASGWGPWTSLGAGLGAIADRRQTRIYEIAVPDIVFRGYDYPRLLEGGRLAVRLDLAPGLDKLDKGRHLVIEAGATRHLADVTATQLVSSRPGELPDHLLVDFTPPLPKPIEAALLHANVAEASHGETQPDETLGNGDATRAFQRFRLARSPLTYIPSETDIAGTAELDVRINGALWQRVPSLFARQPTERVYTVAQTDEGDTIVTFGDGTTGARLPTGAMNVVARYRTGVGVAGRVTRDQLSILLERPVGLRGVTNPIAADGGADPETRDDARSAAPTTVRTFGRAVSLDDFAWLATTSGLVARAHATWVWHRLEKTVHLTVAAADGASLSPASLVKLYKALTAARDPNRPLLLANLVRVPLVVRAKLLADPTLETDAVLAAARDALLGHFAFATTPLGRAVHASDVYAVLQGAAGVVAVDVDLFHLKGFADLSATERAVRAVTADLVQPHIRIFPARPTPADPTQIDRFARAGFDGPVPPPVLAAEQAFIEDPVADVTLTIVQAF